MAVIRVSRSVAWLVVLAVSACTVIGSIAIAISHDMNYVKPSTSASSTSTKPEFTFNKWTMEMPSNIVLKCDLPEVPDSVPRLGLLNPSIDRETAYLIAQECFGFSSKCQVSSVHPVLGEVSGYFQFTDGGKSLEIDGLMRITYHDGDYYAWCRSRDRGAAIHLPSYEEAENIALTFISKLMKTIPVPPDFSIRLKDVRPGTVEVTEFLDGTRMEKTLDLLVVFELELHGIKATGAGADFTVCIGHEGKVVGAELDFIWSEVEGRVDIITPEEALERFRQGHFVGPRPLIESLPDPLVIKAVNLAYYVDLPGYGQSYAPVVYEFIVELEDGSILPLMVSAEP